MRKLKNNDKVEEVTEVLDPIEEKESIYTKIILLVSFLVPFFGIYFIYFFHIKLPKRTRFIMCQILNKNITMSLVYLAILTSARTIYANTGDISIFQKSFSIALFLLFASILFQLIKTYYWLKGKDVKYKYILKLFREEY